MDRSLEAAESIRLTAHDRFVAMLAQLHASAATMTPGQQWHLRYLEAWEHQFRGEYAPAEAGLRDIMEHSNKPGLAAKSLALLMSNMAANRRYEDAFAFAKHAVEGIADVRDAEARGALLFNLSQTVNLAGHPEVALQYARMMGDEATLPEDRCRAVTLQMAARYSQKSIRADSPDLANALAVCTAAGQSVYANSIWLTQSTLLIEEHHPDEALAVLGRIQGDIERSGYYPHLLSLHSQLAQAFEALGRYAEARKSASVAIGLAEPGDMSEFLRDSYRVLYEVEKRAGNSVAALANYQHFADQERGYLTDVSARAMAYEAVQQRSLLQKMETDKLARRNHILQLEQSLSTKAMETSRLYIALLVVVLASLMFWLFRTKRSQMRFKRMSHYDGLTGIFNHQHFMGEIEAALHAHEKRDAPACLVLLDLDHFKTVNDTYGHAIGDAVLQRTVTTCHKQLRNGDLFGRLGGEEFGILLHDTSEDQGLVVANRIRAAIESASIEIDGYTVRCSTSVGIASSSVFGYALQILRREADAALYRAKRAGRNRVVTAVYGDGLVGA